MAYLGEFLLVGSQLEPLQGLSHLCKNAMPKLFVVYLMKSQQLRPTHCQSGGIISEQEIGKGIDATGKGKVNVLP